MNGLKHCDLSTMDIDHDVEGSTDALAAISRNEYRSALTNDISSNAITVGFNDAMSWQNCDASGDVTVPKLYLVVDTNVLLSHLDYLTAMLEQWPLDCQVDFSLVIPDVVVKELDGLKSTDNSNGPLAAKSRKVISWVGSYLSGPNSHLRGESFRQAREAAEHFWPGERPSSISNDDRVIGCAMYIQREVHHTGDCVVVLSNDKNMCNRASINNVLARDRHGFPTTVDSVMSLIELAKYHAHTVDAVGTHSESSSDPTHDVFKEEDVIDEEQCGRPQKWCNCSRYPQLHQHVEDNPENEIIVLRKEETESTSSDRMDVSFD